LDFDFVGPIPQTPYGCEIKAKASKLPNVKIHGPVPRNEIASFLDRAFCLCSTSDTEGFPNTYLEAWSAGVPVVATFDPDGIIERAGLGIRARSVNEVAEGLRRLQTDVEGYATMSEKAIRYYRENHYIEVGMPRFEEVFQRRPSG
jgi:glycosyltransferase involved in cell wall biosynthesis